MTDHATTLATAIGRLNDGDVDGYITMLYAPDAVFHGFPPAFGQDRDGIGQFFHALVAGLPDVRVDALDLLADGDRLAVRYALTGTHAGELFGTPPTGAHVDVEGITLVRFEGDQVAERWNRLDDLVFLTQVGAPPAAVPA